MPRMLRLQSPGMLAHVMARGIEGKAIFIDDQDRKEFLSRLSAAIADTQYKCLAWCLMKNHYHLLLRTNEKPMSRLMRPLNGGYALWFNRRHGRRGYLFQDRYKSVLCQDQDYACQLIRYIHLNPIRGGLVRSLAELGRYHWCGHGFLLGVKGSYGKEFQERTETLRRFAGQARDAVDAYCDFLAEGIDLSNTTVAGALGISDAFEVSGSQNGWPAVIGDPEFARQAMERHEIGARRRHRQADYTQVLTDLAKKVCARSGIPKEDLFRRGRDGVRSRARAAFSYEAHIKELLPHGAIARFLNVTLSAIPYMVGRGMKLTGSKAAG